MRNLLIKSLVSIFFLFLVFAVNPEKIEFYRSNYNGLLLLKIEQSEISKYKYVIKQILNEQNNPVSRQLFSDNKEVKNWFYNYNGEFLSEEVFQKEGLIAGRDYYDSKGHKILTEEYNNGEIIIKTRFGYNKDGLVSEENIENYKTGKTMTVLYKYDSDFRIKQIIKKFSDGKVVYWDSTFTNKGIITKEYYTMDNETYSFYYNGNGQEIKGEVFVINPGKEPEKKIYWELSYEQGIKKKKEEINYQLDLKSITYYDKDGRDLRMDVFRDDVFDSSTYYRYDKEGNVAYKKEVKGLFIKEWFNRYVDNKLSETLLMENRIKKKFEKFYPEGKTESIFMSKNKVLEIKYNKDNVIIAKNIVRFENDFDEDQW